MARLFRDTFDFNTALSITIKGISKGLFEIIVVQRNVVHLGSNTLSAIKTIERCPREPYQHQPAISLPWQAAKTRHCVGKVSWFYPLTFSEYRKQTQDTYV